LRPFLRPLIFCGLSALGLLAFYLGIFTLAQGWEHAVQQLADDRCAYLLWKIHQQQRSLMVNN